jgi:hypothetical protein
VPQPFISTGIGLPKKSSLQLRVVQEQSNKQGEFGPILSWQKPKLHQLILLHSSAQPFSDMVQPV